MTLITPSIRPTVCLYSSPIVMVTFPVALTITVILTTATSPKVMFSTLTVMLEGTLLTLNDASPSHPV